MAVKPKAGPVRCRCGDRPDPGYTLAGRPCCEVCWSRYYPSWSGKPAHLRLRAEYQPASGDDK